MLEQLVKLVKDGKAEAIHLSIRPTGKDGVQVVLNCESCPLPEKVEDAKTLNIRAALAQPLTVTGSIGEMDVFFTEELTKYAESYAPVSAKFVKASNADKLVKNTKESQKKPSTVEVAKDVTPTASDSL